MNKSIIFNIIVLAIFIVGIVSIIIAIIKPMKLIKLDKVKLNGKNYIIKDKQGYIKYNQKVHLGFGIMCSAIAILSLLRIIDNAIFCIGLSVVVIIVGLINSISIKKYA